MPEYEVINLVMQNEGLAQWWEAQHLTPNGMVVVAQSDKILLPDYSEMVQDFMPTKRRPLPCLLISALLFPKFVTGQYQSPEMMEKMQEQTKFYAEYDRKLRDGLAIIVAKLAAEGWEPVGTDESGYITVMKRVKSA
jgi:hypothetical protein